MPTSLFESELFGHERGAFTGADRQKVGRIELTDGGTLFLDEIAEIPLDLQPKLLRVLQEREFERVGGNRTLRVDTRIIAATNRNLQEMIADGQFRSDLYYRLAVFPVTVPPLRSRRSDVPLLVQYFVEKCSQRLGRHVSSVPNETMMALTEYSWPGNIRELQHLIERALLLTNGSILQVPLTDLGAMKIAGSLTAREQPAFGEREAILQALTDANGVVSGPTGAAARLGLPRTTLQSKMKRLKISRQYR
jgi:formate hydrogenlyase transcriptional activator